METTLKTKNLTDNLPNLDCGACGFKTCQQFAAFILEKPGYDRMFGMQTRRNGGEDGMERQSAKGF
jgi:Na+-translocating ferredoxin:NAD+ oxidoreductase RNF subunit RnfB